MSCFWELVKWQNNAVFWEIKIITARQIIIYSDSHSIDHKLMGFTVKNLFYAHINRRIGNPGLPLTHTYSTDLGIFCCTIFSPHQQFHFQMQFYPPLLSAAYSRRYPFCGKMCTAALSGVLSGHKTR